MPPPPVPFPRLAPQPSRERRKSGPHPQPQPPKIGTTSLPNWVSPASRNPRPHNGRPSSSDRNRGPPRSQNTGTSAPSAGATTKCRSPLRRGETWTVRAAKMMSPEPGSRRSLGGPIAMTTVPGARIAAPAGVGAGDGAAVVAAADRGTRLGPVATAALTRRIANLTHPTAQPNVSHGFPTIATAVATIASGITATVGRLLTTARIATTTTTPSGPVFPLMAAAVLGRPARRPAATGMKTVPDADAGAAAAVAAADPGRRRAVPQSIVIAMTRWLLVPRSWPMTATTNRCPRATAAVRPPAPATPRGLNAMARANRAAAAGAGVAARVDPAAVGRSGPARAAPAVRRAAAGSDVRPSRGRDLSPAVGATTSHRCQAAEMRMTRGSNSWVLRKRARTCRAGRDIRKTRRSSPRAASTPCSTCPVGWRRSAS